MTLSVTAVEVNSSGEISVSGLQDCSAAVKALLAAGTVPADAIGVLANTSWTARQRTASGLVVATYGSQRANPCWADDGQLPGVVERCVQAPDGTYHPCTWSTAIWHEDNSWDDPGFFGGSGPFQPGPVQVSASLEATYCMLPGPTPQAGCVSLAATTTRSVRATLAP